MNIVFAGLSLASSLLGVLWMAVLLAEPFIPPPFKAFTHWCTVICAALYGICSALLGVIGIWAVLRGRFTAWTRIEKHPKRPDGFYLIPLAINVVGWLLLLVWFFRRGDSGLFFQGSLAATVVYTIWMLSHLVYFLWRRRQLKKKPPDQE